MGRAVEDVGPVVEDFLRAVAVVHIYINDGHAAGGTPGNHRLSSYGSVVEQTETHGPVAGGVVARRADEYQGIRLSPGQDVIRGMECSASRTERCLVGASNDEGVGVEPAPARLSNASDALNVLGSVDRLDVSRVSRLRVWPRNLAGVLELVDGRKRGGQAIGPFRVPR